MYIHLYSVEPCNMDIAGVYVYMYMYNIHVATLLYGCVVKIYMELAHWTGTTATASDVSSECESHITVEVGVFGGEAVRETAQDICEELNGVSVGRMGQRILYMVRELLVTSLIYNIHM